MAQDYLILHSVLNKDRNQKKNKNENNSRNLVSEIFQDSHHLVTDIKKKKGEDRTVAH